MPAETTTTTERSAEGSPAASTSTQRARLPITRWVLREQRRALVLWTLSLAGVGALYVAFWPSMGDSPEMTSLIDGLPEALRVGMGWDRIGSAAGYLESTVYGLLGPILLLVFAVATGARLLAGEEEAGTLELESAAPASRRSVLLQRGAVLAVGLGVASLGLGATTVAMVLALDMDVAIGNVLAATLGLWLFVLAMGAVSFAAGAVTGRRGIALGTGAGVTVAAYLAHTLAPMIDGADWLHTVSPYSWYLHGDPLTTGVDLAGFSALVVLIVGAVAVGLARFSRRDLGV